MSTWKAGDWAIFTGAISATCAPAHGRAGRDGGVLVEIIDVDNPDPQDPSLAGHSIFARSSSSGGVGARRCADPRTASCQPRPTNGILVAMMVMNCTLASSGRLAMESTA